MRKTEQTFSAKEMRVAMWAIVIAAVITSLGLIVDQVWSRPSLGQYGAAGYGSASSPGILDAQPMSGGL